MANIRRDHPMIAAHFAVLDALDERDRGMALKAIHRVLRMERPHGKA
jgi:DNA-binding GntR family transcriptional regulator